MKAFEGEGEFRTLLQEDAEIRKHLSADEVDREFDLSHALAHVDTIIDRVLEHVDTIIDRVLEGG
jgi:adenylosuccinate lyase